MTSVVVDTSALLRLFIPDGPVPGGLEQAFRAAERGDASIFAPELLWAEVTQVLHKKRCAGLLSGEECADLLATILTMPVQSLGHQRYAGRALELAKLTNVTAYDALHLSIAESVGATLITADAELERAAVELGLVG